VKIELSRDWTEFLSVLIARRVRFVLVGGHAVAGHGEPRLTEDLDLFVEPTTANAKRLREALEDFGFGAVAPDVEELATPDKIFMLGRKPWRIDILTGIDGVTFREVWSTKVEADFAVSPLFVIGREALLANKRAAARDKDLLDVALLERSPRPPKPKKRKPSRR
jgi:Nucleotidyl transferase AbiEii toxin, Type IV TA system